MTENRFTVTEKSKRPASPNDECCFYCQQSIGSYHLDDCVLVRKNVLIRMTIDYEIIMPASWGKDKIEFHRNNGSWCASNSIQELSAITDAGPCLCGKAKFEYIEDLSLPYLGEE